MDQTSQESLTFLRDALGKGEKTSDVLGTGIFTVPNPETTEDVPNIIVVAELSYDECVLRSSGVTHFKWVPVGVATLEEIQAARTRCSGQFCGPNHDWCSRGCICWGNWCR